MTVIDGVLAELWAHHAVLAREDVIPGQRWCEFSLTSQKLLGSAQARPGQAMTWRWHRQLRIA
jgi:hypothetical protein